MCEDVNASAATDDAQWVRKLTILVGKCISQQRDGYDVLASAAWDDVVEHWTQGENGRQVVMP